MRRLLILVLLGLFSASCGQDVQELTPGPTVAQEPLSTASPPAAADQGTHIQGGDPAKPGPPIIGDEEFWPRDLPSLLRRIDTGFVPLIWPTWFERIAAHGSTAYPGLMERAERGSPETRALALRALVEVANVTAKQSSSQPTAGLTVEQYSEIVNLLLKGLEDPSEKVSTAAYFGAQSLSTCPSSVAIELLDGAVAGKSPDQAYVDLLARSLPEALAALIEHVAGLPADSRSSARDVLSDAIARRRGALDALLFLTGIPSSESKMEVARLLVDFTLSDAAGVALRELSKSEDPEVREVAVRCLTQYRVRRALR